VEDFFFSVAGVGGHPSESSGRGGYFKSPWINAAAEQSQLQLHDHQQVVQILNNCPLPQAKDSFQIDIFRGLKPIQIN
jgi:hypothetical protein